jgi:hypothetical protein
MEAVLLKSFAVAKSGFPSPLKSPMLTEAGLPLGGKGTWGAKVGVGGSGGGGVEQDGGGAVARVRRC